MTFQINKRACGRTSLAVLAAIAVICAPALAAMVGVDCEVSAPFSVGPCRTITGVGSGESPAFSLIPCSPDTGVARGVSEAVSICRPAAEVTGGCKVNVLDLIFVRNRLGEDPTSGENWKADVTGDRIINVLDLIYVRNHLQTTCDE